MKTTLLVFFFFFYLKSYSQTTEIIYLPREKTAVATLRYGFRPIGVYAGGFITKRFPEPFIYRTPVSFINRVGLTVNGNGNKWGIMMGAKIDSYEDKIEVKPDMWINFYPLRTIFNTPNGFDFVLSLNYQNNLTYGVGISIPFGGIY